ncbi:armadillo-type protein [Thamnidium elegans]|nr:armadillo-type protein [Thamnidium elegans]
MTDVLIQLIEEVRILGPELTELILEQFEKFEKGSSNPAYLMALDICFACPNILQRRVCQYFSDALISVSGESSSDEFEEVKKTHNLILKINAAAPDLLLNVLPLLQEEMKVDQLNIRQLATETMGQMFADPASAVAEKYPLIWKTWLGRRDDKAIAVRVKWLEMCVDIYKNHRESVPELIECFKEKLSDPDDKVRTTACKVVGEVDMESDLKAMDKALLKSVAERTKDKKSSVRAVAMNTIGSIYQNCFARIQANDKMAIEKVGWIPDTILNRLYVGELSVTMNLESTIQKYILPELENDLERTERLITIVESLEEKQKLAFTALVRKQKLFNENMNKYVKLCQEQIENNNQSEHDVSKADEFMKYIAGHFLDKARTLNALRSFLNRESDRDIKLLKSCIDLDRDYKRVLVAKNKLLANLNEDQSAIVEIFQALLNRSCPLILNKSNVPQLLKLSKTAKGRRRTASTQRGTIARELLKEISTTYPTMYTTYMKDILQEIMSDNDNTSEESLEILAEISKAKNGSMVYKPDMIERLMSYVTDGSGNEVEYAAIALGNMKNAKTVLADLASNMCDELLIDSANLTSNLTALSQFALYAYDLITPSVDSIIQFIEADLLQARTREFDNENNDWCPYEDLPELSQQKLIGVRLLVNYLTACKEKAEPEDYIVHRIFSILWDLLDRSCDGAKSDNVCAAETSHFRLGASQAIVSLTTFVKYTNELTVPKFEKLGITLQDTCYYVRYEFAESLMKGLQTEQIHSRYYALLFLCAHEPEEALLKQVKSFVQKRLSTMSVKQGESSVLDASLVRLIHLLAHHPDFSVATDDLDISAQYLRFYISCVANADNVSLLYYILQNIKLSQDMVSQDLSENSYVLSDLACALIDSKCKEASWSLIPNEVRVTLHSNKLYRKLPSTTIQAETIKKNYLPNEYIQQLEKEHHHKSGEKRSRSSISSASKRVKV